MTANFTIDKSLCTACGICARECGHHIQINGGTIDPENVDCTHCYHCYTVCPCGAIQPCGQEAIATDPSSAVSNAALLHLLASRRSIRTFEKKPVGDAVVAELIDAARHIPSGGNAHSYEFTVIRSIETREKLMAKLTEIYRGRSRLLNSVLLRNAAKPFVDKLTRGFLRDKMYRGRMKELLARIGSGDDPYFYFAPVIIVIHSAAVIPTPKEDCILAGYNISLMAETMGLGACFVTLAQNAINSSKSCKSLLGLNPTENVNAVVILGHPGVRHLRVAPKPRKEIHWC